MQCSFEVDQRCPALAADAGVGVGAGVHYPATWACLAGGLVMGLGGPVLNRWLRRVMLGNRAGSAR